jgi:hypothetical protein
MQGLSRRTDRLFATTRTGPDMPTGLLEARAAVSVSLRGRAASRAGLEDVALGNPLDRSFQRSRRVAQKRADGFGELRRLLVIERMRGVWNDHESSVGQQPRRVVGPLRRDDHIARAAHDQRRNTYVRKRAFDVIVERVLERSEHPSQAAVAVIVAHVTFVAM